MTAAVEPGSPGLEGMRGSAPVGGDGAEAPR